jgi:hypothetical protein
MDAAIHAGGQGAALGAVAGEGAPAKTRCDCARLMMSASAR